MVSDESISVKNLTYKYSEKDVLDSISLSVGKGEIIGILGPNGCGKTTLLKNLNRNLSPHNGSVFVNDFNLEDITKKEIAKIIAVVPQTNEIRFSFTVREIVSMGRIPFQDLFSGNSLEDEKIIEKAMSQTGILEYADKSISTMSGGERQRAIIARAIAQTPEIILMDEPTLHLDINMQFEVLDLIEKLSKENNLTVVIVSHDLPMVARYCDRIVMLHNKNIFAMGKPEDVLTEENMRVVFNIDAETEMDQKTGRLTVKLHGTSKN